MYAQGVIDQQGCIRYFGAKHVDEKNCNAATNCKATMEFNCVGRYQMQIRLMMPSRGGDDEPDSLASLASESHTQYESFREMHRCCEQFERVVRQQFTRQHRFSGGEYNPCNMTEANAISQA